MQINVSKSAKPNAPGFYIAKFTLGAELITIMEDDRGELYNLNGASTHFSRWHCLWSEKIEINVEKP